MRISFAGRLATSSTRAGLPELARWWTRNDAERDELLVQALRAPTAAEAFAGGGLLSLALHVEGVDVLEVCECDPAAVQTLAFNLHGPDRVRACNARTWTPPGGLDLLVGGPPCQPWSIAGDQRGSEDPRDMWPQVTRWARDVRPRPRIMAWENSANMLSASNRPHVARIRDELAREGFESAVWELDAADYGDPQRRARAWIVAWPAGSSWGGALSSPPPATHGDPRRPLPAGVRPWVRAFDRLQSGCCGGYGLVGCVYLGNLDRKCETCADGSEFDPSPNNDPADVSEQGAAYLLSDERRLRRHPVTDFGGAHAWQDAPEGAALASSYLGSAPTKAWRAKSPYGLLLRGPEALPAQPTPEEAQRLLRFASPREAAKLMGVPVWYAFLGTRRQQLAQVGNGVAVGMGRAVVRHCLRALGFTVPLPGSIAARPHEGLWPLDGPDICAWAPEDAPAPGSDRPRWTATPEAHTQQADRGAVDQSWRDFQEHARRVLGTGDPWVDAGRFRDLDPEWEPDYEGGDDPDTEIGVPEGFSGQAELRRFVAAHGSPEIQRHYESLYGWEGGEQEDVNALAEAERKIAQVLPRPITSASSKLGAEALWWAFGGPRSTLQVYEAGPKGEGAWTFLGGLQAPCIVANTYDPAGIVAPELVPDICTPPARWRPGFEGKRPSSGARALLAAAKLRIPR